MEKVGNRNCDAFNPSWSDQPGNTNVAAIFRMENGVRFNYRSCWVSTGFPTWWDSQWRAIGSNGSALWDGADALAAEVVVGPREHGSGPTEPRTIEVDETMSIGIDGSLRELLSALETGATPTGECHDNMKTMAMVFGTIESAETGRRVDLTG